MVLDPCCGTGALLAAALACGARFALGSDVESAMEPPGTSGHCPGGQGGWQRDVLVADSGQLRLQPGWLDAILCDLPYGYRASAVVAGGGAGQQVQPAAETQTTPQQPDPVGENGSSSCDRDSGSSSSSDHGGSTPAWRQLLGSLLQLGGHALAPGRRLVVWMPHSAAGEAVGESAGGSPQSPAPHPPGNSCPAAATAATAGAGLVWGQQQQQLACTPGWLRQLGQVQGLTLLHYLPETRQSGFPRAVAVLQKGQRPGAAQGASRLSAGAAGAAGAAPSSTAAATGAEQAAGPLGGLHAVGAGGRCLTAAASSSSGAVVSDQAALGRQLRYLEARAARQGRDIDVWRCGWWPACQGGALPSFNARRVGLAGC